MLDPQKNVQACMNAHCKQEAIDGSVISFGAELVALTISCDETDFVMNQSAQFTDNAFKLLASTPTIYLSVSLASSI